MITKIAIILMVAVSSTLQPAASAPNPEVLDVLEAQIGVVLRSVESKKLEIYGMPHDLPGEHSFDKLCQLMVNNWRIAIANMPKIAPDDDSKLILVYSLQNLSPEDYVEAVQVLVGLAEQGNLPKRILRWAISPPLREAPLLIDNYNDPVVVNILKRAIKIYGDEPERVKGFQAILSGESKRAWDERRRLSKVPPAEGGPAPAVYLKNRGNAGE